LVRGYNNNWRETGAKQARNRRETVFFYENAPVRASIAPVSRLFRACLHLINPSSRLHIL
jgi:hypothetical protein